MIVQGTIGVSTQLVATSRPFLADSEDVTSVVPNTTEILIQAVAKLVRRNNPIDSKAKHERGCRCAWCELRHFAGRLHSYCKAVEVFVLARTRWGQHLSGLFDNFEVRGVASSAPTPNPLKRKERTVAEIIGRMTSNPKDKEMYLEHARLAQRFDFNNSQNPDDDDDQSCNLDSLVGKTCHSNTFRPLVHSEILLLDWLGKTGGYNASRFFGRWLYIGSSKPSCLLCCYYFQEHPSRVQGRSTHGNLYRNWRVPDVYTDEGAETIKARERIMNKVLAKVREDAFRTLRSQLPLGGKAYDTNTYSTVPSGHNIPRVAPFEPGDEVLTGLDRLSIARPGATRADIDGVSVGVSIAYCDDRSVVGEPDEEYVVIH
jgi:hypothetical protein